MILPMRRRAATWIGCSIRPTDISTPRRPAGNWSDFARENTSHAMEQFDGTKLYTFELSELLRSGRLARAGDLDPPPPVAIDPSLRDDPTPTRDRS